MFVEFEIEFGDIFTYYFCYYIYLNRFCNREMDYIIQKNFENFIHEHCIFITPNIPSSP